MTIDEMRQLHRSALTDAESKRTELRLVLASRYRELVGSSDEVTHMRERAGELGELVSALPGLVERVAECAGEVAVAERRDGGSGSGGVGSGGGVGTAGTAGAAPGEGVVGATAAGAGASTVGMTGRTSGSTGAQAATEAMRMSRRLIRMAIAVESPGAGPS